ncbi:hypothetical protein FPV21_07395 [Carnobacterium sp. PL12RED10]|uniref:hypothetical protein n=1 Tax=Carnobacterium sp. PL12RED10 TaxID=2592351 RepID=UPI0011EDDF2A|nr:hypothetical protein [Carnobacterium sp. PL12RED10]KAF3299326.1 hypothetical protein FPV21_07395 [Carnobacterium sp. PL12RED10]
MPKYTANITFKGLKENRIYEVGKEFEMTEDRAKELIANIKKDHGVTVAFTPVEEEVDEPIEEPDFTTYKVQELKDYLDSVDIEYDSKAAKAELIKLAEG